MANTESNVPPNPNTAPRSREATQSFPSNLWKRTTQYHKYGHRGLLSSSTCYKSATGSTIARTPETDKYSRVSIHSAYDIYYYSIWETTHHLVLAPRLPKTQQNATCVWNKPITQQTLSNKVQLNGAGSSCRRKATGGLGNTLGNITRIAGVECRNPRITL